MMIQNDKIFHINWKVISICKYDTYKYKYHKINSFDIDLFRNIQNVNIRIKEQLKLLNSREMK
jgi:hypothetical protein